MASVDWRSLPWWAQGLYALGILYLAGFFVYFARFQAGHRHALQGDAAAVARYNRLVRGFPNGFYAKMCGRRPLEPRRRP